MKKLLVVLMILFVGILLAGCASKPTAPVTPTEVIPVATTQIPTTVATAIPTTVVKNATPTATPTPTPTPQPVVTISLTNYNTVIPSGTISITQGTKVVWVNQNQAFVNQVQVQNLFKSPTLYKNQQFSWTFDKAGAYVWYCTGTNGDIKGTIIVK